MRQKKPFPSLDELIDVMTPLVVSSLRKAITSYEHGKPRRWFRLEGDAVTEAGGWPRSWWQSFKDMLNSERFRVSLALGLRLPEGVALENASNRFAWFVVVENRVSEGRMDAFTNSVESTTSQEKRLVEDEIEETIKAVGFDWIRLVHETDKQEVDDWNADSSSDYIRWAGAKIVGILHRDEAGRERETEIEIGHISGRLMMFGRGLNEGVDIWDQADGMDGDLEGAASVLKSFYESDEKMSFGGTDLVVEEMFLKPEYRGRGLATILLRRYIDWHISDLFAVVTYPNADHFFHRKDGKGRIHGAVAANDPLFAANVDAGNEKLRAWCKSLGFEKSEYDGFFVLDADSHDPLWRRREVGAKKSKQEKQEKGI